MQPHPKYYRISYVNQTNSKSQLKIVIINNVKETLISQNNYLNYSNLSCNGLNMIKNKQKEIDRIVMLIDQKAGNSYANINNRMKISFLMRSIALKYLENWFILTPSKIDPYFIQIALLFTAHFFIQDTFITKQMLQICAALATQAKKEFNLIKSYDELNYKVYNCSTAQKANSYAVAIYARKIPLQQNSQTITKHNLLMTCLIVNKYTPILRILLLWIYVSGLMLNLIQDKILGTTFAIAQILKREIHTADIVAVLIINSDVIQSLAIFQGN
ncbi:unnamed protein product [Paramecium octaurelia]|uniref:Uncharacterized protein n=1 Tax=Paramecium octaurelia TaxID=43137 RepID=A0A8S1Y0R1_PAROT|nr:unnamed protein product [Paramecium octaurelia]